jgi:hypothetical protein
MAVKFTSINQAHQDFIEAQKMFIIGSAGAEGLINVSPKGMDTLKIVDEHTVVWVNHTGSGNETSAHVQENGRMTILFQSFEKAPMILKLYGQATVVHSYDSQWEEISKHFETSVSSRQFFEMKVTLVVTSCGYAVPLYDYKGERNTLKKWSEAKGKKGIKAYWLEKNQVSLDGINTNILK